MRPRLAKRAKTLAGVPLLALAFASALHDGPAIARAERSPLEVEIRGGSDVEAPRVRRVLERVLATRVGARARALIDRGAHAGHPLHIELNTARDNHTVYRIPGRELSETIVFDPAAFPLVETRDGMRAAPPETVLAHELGHAVFKLASEDDVIREVENPVRAELGLPPRARF